MAIPSLTGSYIDETFHRLVQYQGGEFADGTGSAITFGQTVPGGSNKSLQFNDNSTFSGSNSLTFDKATSQLSLTGSMDLAGYIRFDPVVTNINTLQTASYIYVSGSTNDLYFSQNGEGYSNVTRLRWIEGNLYTGLLNGGIITTKTTTTYQVQSGSGVIVSLNANLNNNPYPTIKYVNWPTLIANIAPLSASFDQQFVAIDSSSQIFAQGIPYSDGDYNTKIPLGIVIHQNRSTINAVQTFPSVGYGWKQRSFDFIKAFGPLKISGYTLSQSGSSARGMLLSGGTAWVDGRNYIVDPSSPSYITEAVGISTSKIYRYYQSGSTWQSTWGYDTNAGAGYTDIDPTLYSDLGTLRGVASNHWTIQRVFYFPNSATKAFYIYYGNVEYANKADALAGIATETFTEAPNTAANAIFVGYLILRDDATFNTPASYDMRAGGLFRASGVGGGGGGGTTSPGGSNTQIQYNNNGAFGGVTNLTWDGTTLKATGSFTGSFVGTHSGSYTGSLFGTSSWASNAQTASYVLNAVSSSFASTASFVRSAQTASYVLNAVSASYASTSSLSLRSITTASVSLNTITFTKGDGSTFPITVNTGSGGGGGSASPGGSSGQIQYNNGGTTFDGVPVLTYNGSTLSATGSFTGSFSGAIVQPSGTGQLVYGEGSEQPPSPPVHYTITRGGIYQIEGSDPSLFITPVTPYVKFPDPAIDGTTITIVTSQIPSLFGPPPYIDLDPGPSQIKDATGASLTSLPPNRIYNFYAVGGIWYGGYLT